MIICLEFDGVVVSDETQFDDLGRYVFLRGAKAGLKSLKRAGHYLILHSMRGNRIHRGLHSGGAPTTAPERLHEDRFQAMLSFVQRELPGVFDEIDSECRVGKPHADLYIDARTPHGMMPWKEIVARYGE